MMCSLQLEVRITEFAFFTIMIKQLRLGEVEQWKQKCLNYGILTPKIQVSFLLLFRFFIM